MKKKLFITIIGLGIFLSSCGTNVNPLNRWQYDKEDIEKFVTLDIVQENGTFKAKANNILFNKNINKDDIIFFNQDIAERNSQGNSYYTIKAIKDAEVQIEDLSYDKSQQTIQIEYVPEVGNKYGLIVNKEATINNYFAIGINRTTFGEYKESQLEFEEKYINNEPTWNDAKTFINIIGSLTAMWIGGMVPNGTATIAGGLFSFMTNLGDLFNLQVTPTIKDVINKLEIMDGKLDAISEQIDYNQKQLISEFIKTQAQIDDVKLKLYNNDIDNLYQGYIEPLNSKIKVYEDYIEHNLALYAKSERNIDIYYKDNDVAFITDTSVDVSECDKYSYKINFPLTNEYLKKHGNIVSEGFSESFTNDIKNSLTSEVIIKDGKTKEQITDDIYATIIDRFAYDRYIAENKREEIVTYKCKVIDLLNHLVGINTSSIIDSYLQRLKLMYNFAGETKDIFRDILSILRYNIDRFSVQANLACKHAGINAIDLGEAYQRAIKCIRDNYEALNNLDKCYCFTLGSIVRGDMYETSFATYYTNKGNHPTFHASLSTNRIIDIDPFGMRMVIDANLNDLIILSSSDHLRILTRYKILPRNEDEKEMTYYDYLYKVGVINYTTTKIFNRLIELNWMKKQDATFMSEYKIRDLVSGDNIDLVCNEAGNPGGSYFNVGWKGRYRNQDNKREAQYWSGKIAEATFLDINSGSQVNNKNLAVYATYAENHTLWINDEYWSFVGTNNLHFYFMLTVVK